MKKRFASISSFSAKNKVMLVFAMTFAAIGTYLVFSSYAATVTNYAFLNFSDAAQTAGVTNISSVANQIGSQTMSQVAPGGQLTYLVGGKVPLKSICYFLQIMPLKGGDTTAKVSLTAQSTAKTVNINYDPNNSNNFQQVCIRAGSGSPQSYNVANLSPSTGPNVLVYQAVVSY